MNSPKKNFDLFIKTLSQFSPELHSKPHAVQVGKKTIIYFHQPCIFQFIEIEKKDLPYFSKWIGENCSFSDSFVFPDP